MKDTSGASEGGYSLEGQTLDHDSLPTVFLGHLGNRASLHGLVLPPRHGRENTNTRV